MPSRRYLVASVLLLVAMGLRLLALDIQPLWWDEGYSLFFATESPGRLLALTSYDIHPPLYYLLLQGWLALVGIGSWQARLLSVAFSLLSLPVAWVVARRFAGRATAWALMILLAVSPLAIYYAQEVRMYSLVTLLALLATAAWQRRAWGWLALWVVLGSLTHYYFALFALALVLLTLMDVRAGRYDRRGPLRAAAVAALGMLPWLLYAAPRLLTYVGGKLQVEADRPMTPAEFLPRHLAAWSLGHPSEGWGWLAWGALAFVALAVVAFVRAWSRRHSHLRTWRALMTVALLVLVPTAGAFLIGLRAPFVDARIERQLLLVQPFFLLLVARGIIVLWRRWSLAVAPLMTGLVLLSLAALGPFYTISRYPGEDYRELLARVGAAQAPGDGWLAVYPWQVGFLRAYLPRAHPTPIEVPTAWADDPGSRDAGLAALYGAHPRLWFPAYQIKGRLFEEELARDLGAIGVPARDDWHGNSRLYLFGRAPQLPPLASIGRFEGVGEAEAALGAREAASAVGIVPLFLRVAEPPQDARVSVQLVGAGSVWGEWDGELDGQMTRIGLPVASGTPPGTYAVQMTLYREGSPTPLARFVGEARQRPEADLGPVIVTRPALAPPAEAARNETTDWLDVPLGGALRLLGAALPEQSEWLQGDRVPLTLFWRGEGEMGDLRLFVQAVDGAGVPRAARDLPPVNGAFSTSGWEPGDLVRDPHTLALPADMPPGEYRLIVGAYDPASGTRLAAPDGRDAIELGTLRVAERARVMEEPTIGERTNVLDTVRARLARVEAPPTLVAGELLDITLVWQATALARTDAAPLRAFAQLFAGEQLLAVSDHPLDPPSTAWVEGEWVVDPHTLAVPAELPPGEYHLLVGLYDSATGERLGAAVAARWER